MSLRKRGGIWWVDVVAPNGERIRQSAGTANKALAQEFHDRQSELWRIIKLGEKPRRTWNDAVVRWLKEQSHKAMIDTTDQLSFAGRDRPTAALRRDARKQPVSSAIDPRLPVPDFKSRRVAHPA